MTTGRPSSQELAEVPADAVLHIYWCPKCERQIEHLWHTVRRGPPLIPQLDEEHYGIRVRVSPAARLQATEQALRQLRERAAREPLEVDISDYGDEWCAGFLAGQANALDAARRALEGAAE